MALNGCGHDLRPGLRFCTICGAPATEGSPEPTVRSDSPYAGPPPTVTSGPSGDPPGPARWGSPEFYAPTMDARGTQPPAAEPGSYYQPSPVDPVVYEAPAPPPYSPPITPPLLPPAPPRQPAPRQGGPRRSRGLLIGLITFLAAAAVAAAVVLIAHPFGSGTTPAAATSSTGAPASPTTSPPPSPTASASSSAAPTEQQAAQNLAGLLSQSVSDRSAIVAAVNDVNTCGSNLSQDPQTFQNAATSRQSLLNQLASLPGSATLPSNMLAALTSAWQNSMQADQDFAKWAQDESAGCTSGSETTDSNALAATGPDNQATTDKKTFVGLWNPIATQYQLTTYQWNQL
jgi:outer membrane biosynthesis protein TonB